MITVHFSQGRSITVARSEDIDVFSRVMSLWLDRWETRLPAPIPYDYEYPEFARRDPEAKR